MEVGTLAPRLPNTVVGRPVPESSDEGDASDLSGFVDKVACEKVLRAMEKYGSQQLAAQHLGIHQSTVSRKLKKLRGIAER